MVFVLIYFFLHEFFGSGPPAPSSNQNKNVPVFGGGSTVNAASKGGKIGEASVEIGNMTNNRMVFGENCTVNSAQTGGRINKATVKLGDLDLGSKKK